MIWRGLVVWLALCGAAIAQPAPETFSFTQDQVATLKRALVAADFWFSVRVGSSSGNIDSHGFELQRFELGNLALELVRLEQINQEAAKKKAAEPKPAAPEGKTP
jgi:hypothetical protein